MERTTVTEFAGAYIVRTDRDEDSVYASGSSGQIVITPTQQVINTPYVDIRGVWPTYCCGKRAVTLEGYPRDITLQDAQLAALAYA